MHTRWWHFDKLCKIPTEAVSQLVIRAVLLVSNPWPVVWRVLVAGQWAVFLGSCWITLLSSLERMTLSNCAVCSVSWELRTRKCGRWAFPSSVLIFQSLHGFSVLFLNICLNIILSSCSLRASVLNQQCHTVYESLYQKKRQIWLWGIVSPEEWRTSHNWVKNNCH